VFPLEVGALVQVVLVVGARVVMAAVLFAVPDDCAALGHGHHQFELLTVGIGLGVASTIGEFLILRPQVPEFRLESGIHPGPLSQAFGY
jgi:hypothetical protein